MSNTDKLPGVRDLFPEMFPDRHRQYPPRQSWSGRSSSTSESPTSSEHSSPVLSDSRHLASPKHSRPSNRDTPKTFDPRTYYDLTQTSLPHDHAPLSDAASSASKKKYLCTVCFRRFERPSSLETHMNSHTGARPHVCPQPGCAKAFTTRSNMQRHFRSHDTVSPPWSST